MQVKIGMKSMNGEGGKKQMAANNVAIDQITKLYKSALFK
jgi:hypothetical protein